MIEQEKSENLDALGVDLFSSAVFLSQFKRRFSDISVRINFAVATYPDREAMIASNIATDLLIRITDCELSPEEITVLDVRGVDCKYIKTFDESLHKPTPKENERYEVEEEKVCRLISEQTGVSRARMREATNYWLDTVLD